MNKSDVIRAVADKKGISVSAAGRVIDTMFGAMAKAIMKGERIDVRGFGSFMVRVYPGRTAHNPKTGCRVNVGSRSRPYFRAGKELKAVVAASGEPGCSGSTPQTSHHLV